MIVVGERINATRKSIREAIRSRDRETIQREIIIQDRAGAHFIDLNAGTGSGEINQEADDLRWLIDVALESTDKNLTLDTADPAVMRRAAKHVAGRRPWLLNSVKGSALVMEPLLVLAVEHDAPIVALAMNAMGIPGDSDQRIAICEKIFEEARHVGIPEKNLFFDPLVLPLSADISQGRVTLETLRGIKERFPRSKTTLGLSNISYGLPQRSKINRSFVIAAISHGLDAAICDPTNSELRQSILLGELIAGRDRHCRRFTRAARKGEFEKGERKPHEQ